MTKESQLMIAYNDKSFQNELKIIRLSIEDELKNFLQDLKNKLSPEQKLFENIESRIKSSDSFQEKLHRKDYIHIWQVGDDTIKNQRLIAENLPDLIGFRINCFFWIDEKNIYNFLHDYYSKGNFPNFVLDFTENMTQKNGHEIYKLTGKYRNPTDKEKIYNFEIQIKSIMHNIWGEVDHKTIFKSRDYDADSSSKKVITEELFHILQASDKQLLTLLGRKNEERQLINALFFNQTKQEVMNKCGSDILASHYTGFFEFFKNHKKTCNCIKQYVAHKLLNTSYSREILPKPKSNEQIEHLEALISHEFYDYNLKCMFHIVSLLYLITDTPNPTEEEMYATFLKHLSSWAIEFSGIGYIDEYEDFDFDNSQYDDKDLEDPTKDILQFLNEKIGGRKHD